MSEAAPASTSWTVGELTIHRIDETPLPPETGAWLLPEATRELVRDTAGLSPHFADPTSGALHLASHSFAVEVNGVRVVIDTGIGNHKPRANAAWNQLDTHYLDRLTAAGFPPDSVDLVILTHLHTDHVGWNTRLDDGAWVPTFPRARYLTTDVEWEHWTSRELDAPRQQMFDDSIHPIRHSGQLELVPYEPKIKLQPDLHLIATPGHTPGQVAVQIGEGAAVISGDAIHHPIQLSHPNLCSSADTDPALAVRSRHQLLQILADTHALLLGSHFPHPTAGRISDNRRRFSLHTPDVPQWAEPKE